MTSGCISVTFFHIVCKDTLLPNDNIAVGIPCVVYFVVELFFMLKFRIFH